jgi:two-component system, sensor histidine kinase LadS
MKRIYLSVLLILMVCFVHAQEESVIWDGFIGIYRNFDKDTLYIPDIMKNSPAEKAGLRGGDRVIEINGVQVSGAGLSLKEIDKYLHNRAGDTIHLKTWRSGVDTLLSFKITKTLDISYEQACNFEYLVDYTNHLTIYDILSDSINQRFFSQIENKILIRSVEKGSKAEKFGLKPGDRISSLYNTLNFPGEMLEYSQLKDTSFTIIRNGVKIEIPLDPKNRPLEGVLSQFRYDFTNRCLWLKFTLDNKISEDRTYLVDIWPNDSISLYEIDSSKKIIEKKSGSLLQCKEKNFPIRNQNFIKVNLKKDQKQTFYARIINDEGDSNPLVLVNALDYITRLDRFERFLLGSLYGMMLILAIYYLILFFFVKEWSYIYYFFFIISFGFILINESGYGAELIWPNSPAFLKNIDFILIGLSFTFFLLFGLAYMNIRHIKKFWYRVVIINLVVIWIPMLLYTIRKLLGLLSFSGIRFTFDDSLELIIGIGLICTAFILLIPAILTIREGYKPSRYFLAANIIMLLVIGFFSISSGGGPTSSDLTQAIYSANIHFGVVLQFLVFAFGLGSKIRTAEKEKKEAQERTIEQLKENEKLKDKVNRELEQKVRERTEEVVQQKEEIETQRDELKRQRDVLTEQKQEITDSINYAQKIQSAVLPTKEFLEEILPDHFVLFKPRDIVSGDFYWIRQIKNYTVVAAADCTGHGVPGAFMSMLGMALLNEQISKSKFDRAGEILDHLRNKVKETLKQEGKPQEQREGMDMALAIIDNNSLELQFAGAYNPLYVIRKKENTLDVEYSNLFSLESDEYCLYEIKGDRQPIGIHSEEMDFTTHHYKIQRNDTLYIFSDGYVDQVGGPKGKKFMVRKFKEILLQIQNEPMNNQKEILNKILEDYKGNIEQIDDILVFGIRWN